jgi:hypothetical protein
MQSFLRAATAAALTAGVLAIAAVPAVAGTPTDSSSLRSAVTAKNVKKHMSALQTIANINNGTRASGTPGYDASLAYVKGQRRDRLLHHDGAELPLRRVPRARDAGVRADLA